MEAKLRPVRPVRPHNEKGQLERLYALAAEDEHPGVGTFLDRMSWLPLLAELEPGKPLDG